MKTGGRILICAVLALAFHFSVQSASPAASANMELTPSNILRHIETDGPRLTVSRLRNEITGSRSNYEWVVLKVESGELVWLQIANALLPGLDPLFQHEMFVSAAKAMGNRPDNAVRLLREGRWPLEYLCDAPFQEISREGWEEHLLKVQSGLIAFKNASFQPEKELCLKYIDWALQRYPQPMPKELDVAWSVPQDLP